MIKKLTACLPLVLLTACSHTPTGVGSDPVFTGEHGYFVSGDLAQAQGGVGNYIPRPSGRERIQQERMRRLGRIAQFDSTHDGLALRMRADLMFPTDSAELRPEAADDLAKLGEYLRERPENHIRIEGYADSTGTHPYNEVLSQERALAVRKAILVSGVNPAQLQTAAYGENHPVSTNATAAGRAENRRVEIKVGK